MFQEKKEKRNNEKNEQKNKRKLRNRKIKDVNFNRYRVSVAKSLNNLSAQIIDDKQKTLVSASSIEKDIKSKIKKMDKHP